MGSQSRHHLEDFKVVLDILQDIHDNNGRPESELDKGMLKLHVSTLTGMGYVRKEAQGCAVTENGREELRWH